MPGVKNARPKRTIGRSRYNLKDSRNKKAPEKSGAWELKHITLRYTAIHSATRSKTCWKQFTQLFYSSKEEN
jgi:hypothetical protein